MTPTSSADRSLTTSMTMTQQESKKRPAPIFVPAGAKKRRGLVNRTHSPRSETSPLSSPYLRKTTSTPPRKARVEVRSIFPTVKGVTEVSRLMGNGEVVVLPTETVYMACTLLSLESDEAAPQRPSNKLRIICPDHHDREAPTLLMQRPLAMLDRLMPFAQKPYAIQEKDGKASAPVVFSEHREVLIRLAKKFWPGPMAMYMRTDSESLPIQSVGGKTYVGVSNPSHPLTNRLLNEASSNSRIVVGKPAFRANSCTINKKNPYMTKAAEVCSYYASQFLTEKHTVHVLNGEDKREPFAVPTCQYGTPCSYSLWIDETCRTVYIRGKQEDPSVLQEGSILRAIGSISSSPTEDERTKNRLRVTTAVLRRWKVVDERLSPILDGTA